MGEKKEFGVGILGYGFMGKTHAYAHTAIPFYYDPPVLRHRLRVICDSNAAKLEEARIAGGFDRATANFMEVINADDVDIIHICTPNHEHMPALRAAIAKDKHIYVEKPVTANLTEADELEKLLKGYKGKAQTVFQNRFFTATLRAKQLIEEGFIGPVTHFRAAYLHGGSVDPDKAVNWKSTAAAGGGVIRDLGIHILDLLWWLVGPFESALCNSRVWSPKRPSADKPGSKITVDAEEAAVMLLRAKDGAFGTVEASKIATGTEDELRFEIHGRHGAMRFNLMEPNYLEVFDERTKEGDYGGERGWKRISCIQKYPGIGSKFPGPKFTLGWIRAHVHSLYSFLESIADNAQPKPSLSDGIHMQRVLEAVRNSAETQTWIKLPQKT
jgi:predicted dehydrogenase